MGAADRRIGFGGLDSRLHGKDGFGKDRKLNCKDSALKN